MAKEKSKEEKKSYEEVLKEMNTKYGKNSVINFETKDIDTEYDVIPSGSIKIDYGVLGVGGFCKGRIYMLKGWQGSNKTTLCGHIVANCQKMGGNVLYVDSEHAVSITYLSQLGVDITKLNLCQAEYGEMGFDVALKLMETGGLDLVIFDSDSALIPKVMLENEVNQATIGKKAKLNSDVYPKLKIAASKYNVCIISIAQYRVDPGKMFGDNRVVPGGHSLGYYSDCIMDLTKTLKKEGDETCGTLTTVKTDKNKMFLPFRSEVVPTAFGKGIDFTEEIIDLAKEYLEKEIFNQWGKKTTFEGIEYITDDFPKLLEDNPELFASLKEKVLEKIKN